MLSHGTVPSSVPWDSSTMTTARERLPDRREHELATIEVAGIRYHVGVGRFADGRLAEVFLNSAKGGTMADVAARDSAIVASLALQAGVTVETIRHALTRNGDGTASGPLGHALDLIAK